MIILYNTNIIASPTRNEIRFDRISTFHGLPSNIIRCIYQDKTGFIWIGTPQGLCQYSGKDYKVYYASDSKVSILDNHIIDIYEDKNENLWILTRYGLNLFNRSSNTFERYQNDQKQKNHLLISLKGKIIEDNENNLWIGDTEGGLFRFNKNDKAFKWYESYGNSVSYIYFDQLQSLWIGSVDGYLSYYNRDKDIFTQYKNPYLNCPHFPKTYVSDIKRINDSLLQIANSTGVFIFNIYENSYSSQEVLKFKKNNIAKNDIKLLFFDIDSSIWVGTGNKGIFHLSKDNKKPANYLSHPNNSLSISNNDINAVFRDREGNLWIGTQDGLNFSDTYKTLFSHFQNNPENTNSLNVNFVTSFCEDSKGNIWIGTFGGGVNVFNRRTQTFNHYTTANQKSINLVNNSVRAICEDINGNIWIGTTNGLTKFYTSEKKYENFYERETSPKDDIMCIKQGVNNDIWVGTFGAGVNRIDIVTGKVLDSFSSSTNPALNSDYIRSIYISECGKIYLGTLGGGLNVLNLSVKTATYFTTENKNTASLIDNNINCITNNEEGQLWLATWKGISIFDIQEERIENLTSVQGLPDNNISEILKDQTGSMWVSSNNGLSRLVLREGTPRYITHFSIDNGLQGNKFNVNASLKTSDNFLLFGGTNGFNIFDPTDINVETSTPPLIITGVVLDNTTIYKSSADQNLAGRNRILMSHKFEVLKIEFVSLSYSKRNSDSFKYMLDGFDKQWHTINGESRIISYSNLPPGNYTFKIYNSGFNREWDENGKIIELIVSPPFWVTKIAIILYIIIGLGIILAVRYVSLRIYQKKHEIEIKMLQMKKSEEINQLKLKLFTDLSHEIKTPLTLISGPVKNLIRSNGFNNLVTEQLHMISNNSERLLKLATQIINFRKAESGNISLKVIREDIVLFVRNIKSIFDNQARTMDIDYFIESDTKYYSLLFDPEIIERILINLISNAFNHTPPKGQIIIFIQTTNKRCELHKMVRISVRDNGKGVEKDKQDKIFNRYYQIEANPNFYSYRQEPGGGIGLALSKELIEIHHGSIEIRSEPGIGSEFIISIPNDPTIFRNDEIFEPATTLNRAEIMTPVRTADSDEDKKSDRIQSKESLTILVVDDNQEIADFLRIILENEYTVLDANNGQIAFNLTIEHMPDLIISDIMMPVLNGTNLCHMIKNDMRTCHIPIFLITAYSSAESQIEGYDAGADDYISKPFDPVVLQSRIKNILLNRQNLRKTFSGQNFIPNCSINMNKLDKKFIEKVISIIEESLSEPNFSQEILAREIGMSRSSLYRKLKSLMDKSATEIIRDIKIKKAAQYLQDGYNINEVLVMTGIGSRSYFNKCFQITYGVTPKCYSKSSVIS